MTNHNITMQLRILVLDISDNIHIIIQICIHAQQSHIRNYSKTCMMLEFVKLMHVTLRTVDT